MLRVRRKHFIQEPKELKGANAHNETLLVNTILNGNAKTISPALRTPEVKKKKSFREKIKYIDTSPLLRGNHVAG